MSRVMFRARVYLLFGLTIGGAAVGCGGSSPSTPAAMQTASAAVTPEAGGMVALPDMSVKLDVPPGAVPANTMITMTTTDATPPQGLMADSPILQFEPDGIVFTKPVTVTFTFKNATSPVVFWSNAGGGYDLIEGTVSGTTISAPVMHFSKGFVGERPAGSNDKCASGMACGAGMTCNFGGAGTSGGNGGGTSTSGGSMSGGSTQGGDKGSGPAGVDASASPMSGGTGTSGGASFDGGSTATDPGGMKTSALTAPSSDDGGSSATGMGGSATSGGAMMCCSCASDGTLHCSTCPVTGDNGGGVDAGAMICAEGAKCSQPGAGCGTSGGGGGGTTTGTHMGGPAAAADAGAFGMNATAGDGTGAPNGGTGSTAPSDPGTAPSGGTCCMCGTDGVMHCGGTCGAPISDGHDASTTGGGGGFEAGTGGGGPAVTCAQGAACSPGSAPCADASVNGTCTMCTCGADGTLSCSSCDHNPMGGAGTGGGTPRECAQGVACTPGSAPCADAAVGGACTMCTCGADGTLSCGPCKADQGAPDGGTMTGGPPLTCAEGAACTPGSAPCGDRSPTSCTMCSCTAQGTLSCSPCPGFDGGMSTPPADDAGTAGSVCGDGLACAGSDMCRNGQQGAACEICACSGGMYKCGPCGGGTMSDAGAAPPPDGGGQKFQCAPQAACPQTGLACNIGTPGNGFNCSCDQTMHLACTPWTLQ
jgi:hypothetical protein